MIWTDPCLGTRRLKLGNLLPAFPPRLSIVFHSVKDVMAVQACKEDIPGVVALLARGPVGSDLAAIGGLFGGGSGAKEGNPAHCIVL